MCCRDGQAGEPGDLGQRMLTALGEGQQNRGDLAGDGSTCFGGIPGHCTLLAIGQSATESQRCGGLDQGIDGTPGRGWGVKGTSGPSALDPTGPSNRSAGVAAVPLVPFDHPSILGTMAGCCVRPAVVLVLLITVAVVSAFP